MSKEYRFIAKAPARKAGAYSHFYPMIATPSSFRPACGFTHAYGALMYSLAAHGIDVQTYILNGNCHVDDARNEMLRDFLETTCTDLFFVDDDVGFRARDFIHLLEVPGDIVGGIYPHRSSPETYPFHPGKGARPPNQHGLYPMPKIPTGFMRIRRPVVEALHAAEVANNRCFWRKDDNRELRKPIAKIVERAFIRELGVDQAEATEAEHQSGDYVLCIKARRLGFEVFADVDMPFEHHGEQVFEGHLGNHLRRQQRIDHPLFAEAVRSIMEAHAQGLPPPDSAFSALNEWSMYDPRSALPDNALKACYQMAREAQGPLLECGSGLSTLVMAIGLGGTPHVLYSLESNLEWMRRVSTWLRTYQVDNCTLAFAPLIPYGGAEENCDWYSVNPAELPDSFDGLLVDGPVRVDGNRSMVFALMRDRIAGARMWIIDDVGDSADMEMCRKYVMSVRDVEFQDGIAGNDAGRAAHTIAIARRRAEKAEAAE